MYPSAGSDDEGALERRVPGVSATLWKSRCTATGERKFDTNGARPASLNYLGNKVEPDQIVVNNELSLSSRCGSATTVRSSSAKRRRMTACGSGMSRPAGRSAREIGALMPNNQRQHRTCPATCCIPSWSLLRAVSGWMQVRQLQGEAFSLMEGPSNAQRPDRRIITAYCNTLLLYRDATAQQGAAGSAAEDPVVFFTAPEDIIPAVRCNGSVVCVAGNIGMLCILSAPFLAA